MNNAHGSGTNDFFTYVLGALALVLSKMTLSDWVMFFSLVLVILRIVYQVCEFYFLRAKYRGNRRG